MGSYQINLSIARLGLELDAQGTDLKIISPQSYGKFLKPVAHQQAFLFVKD